MDGIKQKSFHGFDFSNDYVDIELPIKPVYMKISGGGEVYNQKRNTYSQNLEKFVELSKKGYLKEYKNKWIAFHFDTATNKPIIIEGKNDQHLALTTPDTYIQTKVGSTSYRKYFRNNQFLIDYDWSKKMYMVDIQLEVTVLYREYEDDIKTKKFTLNNKKGLFDPGSDSNTIDVSHLREFIEFKDLENRGCEINPFVCGWVTFKSLKGRLLSYPLEMLIEDTSKMRRVTQKRILLGNGPPIGKLSYFCDASIHRIFIIEEDEKVIIKWDGNSYKIQTTSKMLK